jgi:transposase
MVVLGVDPHKQTYTVVAVDQTGRQLAQLTVSARTDGQLRLLGWARQLPLGQGSERRWAVEDGRQVAGRLVAQLLRAGEAVVWVPPKLMANAPSSARTRGKSDPIDAPAVARAALREPGLAAAQLQGPALAVRLVADHREHLVAERTRMISHLRQVVGVGALGAAKLIGETGGVGRFGRSAQFAMHAGVAPIPVWSGNRTRHRLNRGGNRQLNAAIHRVAVTQLRAHPPARALIARRIAAGNSKPEALRVLKRHLADTLYAAMRSDEQAGNTATARQPAAT